SGRRPGGARRGSGGPAVGRLGRGSPRGCPRLPRAIRRVGQRTARRRGGGSTDNRGGASAGAGPHRAHGPNHRFGRTGVPDRGAGPPLGAAVNAARRSLLSLMVVCLTPRSANLKKPTERPTTSLRSGQAPVRSPATPH